MKKIFLSMLQSSLLILMLAAPSFTALANGINKSKAANIAQKVYAGRVLAVKRKAGVFRVKILSHNGEVHIVRINANTAKVISRK